MIDFKKELDQLQAAGLHRTMRSVAGSQGSHVLLDGQDVLLLCSNNYLGLADHPLLKQAALDAVSRYGTGTGAARLVSGNMLLHEELEARLARFKGVESALVFNGGYGANTGIISALVGRGDTIYSDRLNHASIVDGAILSRAKFIRYPHCDPAALRSLLERHHGKGRQLIITDGIFSMDGDLAPLGDLVALKKEFGALLMVDDAHGTGVFGPLGRGSGEYFGIAAEIDVQMGTLGKGLGSFGAYAAGSHGLIDYLRNKARSFIFSTSLPPAVLAASLAAVELVDSAEGEALRSKLRANAEQFSLALNRAGLDTLQSRTHIVPVLVGDPHRVMEFSRQLLAEKIFVQGIRPPTVPSGRCRLRCTLMATHDPIELAWAASRISTLAQRIGVI
jgi:glycine C-acetyltransferase